MCLTQVYTRTGDGFSKCICIPQGGKFDLAQEMCKKCLKYNKSCAKAWEGMGQIMEREQSYRDAAEHYEMAGKYEHQVSASEL